MIWLVFLFSLRIERFLTYSMVCLLSTLYNWRVGSVGAAHPWRMVLPYTPNLHSCVDVRSGGNDLDWDALYGLLRSVHARAFCWPLLLLLLGSRLACQPRAGLLLRLAPFGVVMTVRRTVGHQVTGCVARLAHHPSPGGGSMQYSNHRFFPSRVMKRLHQPTDINFHENNFML